MADEKAVFWLNKTHWQPFAKVSSVEEMVNALKMAPLEVVQHHLNAGKNDFANWAEKGLKDSELARRLKGVKPENPEQNLKEIIQIFGDNLAKQKRVVQVAYGSSSFEKKTRK